MTTSHDAREVVSDEMLTAAWAVWREEGEGPYGFAHVHDFVHPQMSAEARAAGLEALKAEDERLERLNDDLMRRTIAAALAARG